ncbi:MAG: CDP-diacylglycerol--serine O-phosphatidyltransferase [Ruminococcaceae bacterium]|nr:CDP-diacylglycerol--serine O-phosphatidyltransferase [Oscillospiraceae bacterium]
MKFIGFYDYTVILTYLSLISGLLGMKLASVGKIELAVCCLAFCGVCDMFDGAVARTKKNRTEDEKSFGIQLDSLCDLVSFGVLPAVLLHNLGVDGVFGIIILIAYVLCALIRLAFFNVLETKRQQTEEGCVKYYRGLPVTSSSIIFPFFFLLSLVIGDRAMTVIYHVLPVLVAFLFIYDKPVPKLNVSALIRRKEEEKKTADAE